MQEWWAGISSFEKFFWYISIPATTIFAIQMLLTFIGTDVHHDLDSFQDASFDGNIDGGFNLLTLRNIIIFFTGFGWAGIFGIQAGFNNYLTIFLAALVGLFLMFMVAAIYYFMNRLTESGNLNINNALNTVGTVYLPIPGKRAGKGQIQLTVQDSIRELEAITDDEALPTGTTVKVTEIINGQILLVKKDIN